MWSFFRKPPTSVVENVTVDFYQHSNLPGMMEVTITVVAVVSPHVLKSQINNLAYGPKGKLEQFLRLALPYTNGVSSIQKIVDYANKVIGRNKPQQGPGWNKKTY